MNLSTLVKNNLTHFWRTNLAVVLGVATATAVLAGAMLVGDSVRASLMDLALSRLGKTDLLVASTGFFREALADDLKSAESFNKWFTDSCSLIAIEGVVTHSDSNARAGGVAVYGIDERFWKFHGSNIAPPDGNDLVASAALASELNAKPGDTLILRIEKPSAIPVESLHSRKEDLGRSVRLNLREALPPGSIGEFSLRPQQGAVRAIFLPLKKLQRNLEQDDKANAILLSAKGGTSFQLVPQAAEQLIKEKFTLADLSLKLLTLNAAQAVSLESDSAVLSDAIAEKAKTAATASQFKSESFLTYLANSIRIGDKEVPYSLVTAIEPNELARLSPNGVALNDWAARDLGAKLGDEVSLDYYVWKEEGRLDTAQTKFKIEAIVPMTGLAADRNLAPEYPGISDAKTFSDWDPPFPVDLSRVRKVDEDYWDKYRTTPKAFISLEAGQKLWGTRWGKLTSIRLSASRPPEGGTTSAPPSEMLETVKQGFEKTLRDSLDPAQMGLTVQPVRYESLRASRGATDFGEYFTYFSFFLVVSALLLTTLFFKLGIEQRLREIGLLRALGFSIKQVRSLFLREGLLLAVIGSFVGLIGAIVYGWAMMFGLRTWWVGAVGTTLLRLHISPTSLAIGFVSGIIAALLCIWLTLRLLRKLSPRNLLSGSTEILANDVRSSAFRRQRERSETTPPEGGTTNAIFTASRLAVIFGVLGIAMLASAKFIGQVGGFFGAGTFLLVALLFFWSAWLNGMLKSDKRQTISGQGFAPMAKLGFRNASIRPSRSVLCIALIASAAFIIVSVDAFRKDSGAASLDPKSGTGGFPLLAESLLPIVHDPNSEQGRDELNLLDDTFKDVRLTRFRLRPGDDASCLNLYAPRSPRVLGVTDEFIKANRFSFAGSLAETEEQRANPWLLLNSSSTPDSRLPTPVIADANSLMYVLHLKVGDETALTSSHGEVVKLKIVGALSDSIFQGEVLMAESNFVKVFPDEQGYRVFLAETSRPTETAAALEDRLSDYGFDAISTDEKLASFHQVENTYLSTFQTLGGLGLLLGTFGLATVLLRNVLERRRELALMRAVGYQSSHLSLMVVAENALLLGCGLLSGIVCALVAIAPAFIARGGKLSIVSLALLLLAVLLTGLSASLVAVRAAVRSPLLASLRTE